MDLNLQSHKCTELIEYRIHLPCSVAEYRVGQIYMVAKHCHQQSRPEEGVRVMINEPYTSAELGPGRYCEKRLYLGSRLPQWVMKLLPGDGPYVVEKSYNHYPYTKTEYTCSFMPKFYVRVDTKFSDGLTEQDNIFNLSPADLQRRRLVHIDIAHDPLDPKKYREDEDVTKIESPTGRLPLGQDWQRQASARQCPVLCSYKLMVASFPVWGLQRRVESYIADITQQIVTHFHRQAASCIDEWLGLSEAEVRAMEKRLNEEMNRRVAGDKPHPTTHSVESSSTAMATAAAAASEMSSLTVTS